MSGEPSNVVCEGGPWNGWWLTQAQMLDNQQAVRRVGHDPASVPGTVLRYQPTKAVAPCPTPKRADGQVWRWKP